MRQSVLHKLKITEIYKYLHIAESARLAHPQPALVLTVTQPSDGFIPELHVLFYGSCQSYPPLQAFVYSPLS
jgi:hypothetical protein